MSRPRTEECPFGHPYDEENTYYYYQGTKRNKYCRKCLYRRKNQRTKNKKIKNELVKTLGETEGLRVYEEMRKK